MSGAFDRLSPALQHQIVNSLGFRDLRPVQELATAPILDGKNVVVLAPTAGGKTEAAFFPLLSRMDTEDWRPVSVVYVAPLRALLNNQEVRVERYAGLLGRRAFKWHGDVTPSRRAAFANDPADILLTTPESLEVMLMSPRVPSRRLFQHLRAVVIDEIHDFAGDDRGGHLSALLERLCRIAGADVQRIGLSATVGNPEDILTWAAGSSRRKGIVVQAPGVGVSPELVLDYVASLENAARVIAALHPGRKRLVFVDSRRGVEALGRELRALGVEAFVTHSSLSLGERRAAEKAFEQGRDCVIVTTSALELGIDIGDLDHVLQVDAPSTVAGFVQRMGRTGRRLGAVPNYTFLATDDEALLVAAGLLSLHRAGFVEDVRFGRRAPHLLAHQLLALAIQEQGVPASDWWAWVERATPFQALTLEDRTELLEHMLAQGVLHRDGGRLGLGEQGEKLYGFRHFMELYAVFSTPRTLTVLWGADEIGTIDALFVEREELSRLSFTLGARAWRAVHVDWQNALVHVEPSDAAALPRWQGRPVLLHGRLCTAIKDLLLAHGDDPWWSHRARERMSRVRGEYDFLDPGRHTLARESGGHRLWTFAGGAANNLLARILEARLGEKITAGNFAMRFREEAGKSEAAIRDAFAELRAAGRPSAEDALRFAPGCARGRLSKFEPCLSGRLAAIYLADVLMDPGAAAATTQIQVETSGDT